MIYDKAKRRFIFQNKAEVKPSAILFYDLPHLLSPGEDICPEVTLLAERLPQMAATTVGANNCCAGALPHQVEAITWATRSEERRVGKEC